MVTVQLPVFNEKYVIERLIDSVVQLDYPKDKLEIQVLDDSTDESIELAARKIKEYQLLGYNIQHIFRSDRVGFKAGALAYGTKSAKGEFLAIFDADFVPDPSFLKRTVPYFESSKIGCVQTRWSHLNKDYSVLTKMQAFGLDAHFTVEQTGRNSAQSFINFNGTAGIWRKACIEDAGGWSADTLTEDLDLSYRAQLKGWKFQYAEDVESPAELPVIMPAIKSQQFRWNKGAAETARKNLGKVLRSDRTLMTKFHAFFHLNNSSVFLYLFAAALLSIPVLLIKVEDPVFDSLKAFGHFLFFGFLSVTAYFYTSTQVLGLEHPKRYFFKVFPVFLTISLGLSFHNSLAVAEGLLGKKTAFIRTPKFNILSKKDSWIGNRYIKLRLDWQTIVEGLLACYFGFGILMAFHMDDFIMIIFHVMLTLGFSAIFVHSIRALRHA